MDDIFLLFILFIISKIMFQVFFHIFHLLKFHHSGTHFLYQFRTVADYDHTNSSSLGFFHKEMPDLALSNKVEHCTDLICQKKSCSFSKCSCNTESLQFSPGKFRWKAIHPVRLYSQFLYQFRLYLISFFKNISHPKSRIHRLLRVLPDHLYRTIGFIRI